MIDRHIVLTVLIVVLITAAGCDQQAEPIRFTFETMGTVATGQVYAVEGDILRPPAELVTATFDSVNTRLSAWSEESEVGLINAAPADSILHPSAWLITCLLASEELAHESNGAFDPTAEPLMRLWGFFRRQGRLPSQAEIDSARALIGGYTLDAANARLIKQSDRTRFDFGGIAKGFAVDRAIDNLRALGVQSALIDLGGNLYSLGLPPGREAWRVGVRDPLDKSRIFATMELRDRAVATSGAYERFVEIDGRRYGHIMNPATGRPAEGLLSVTIITDSAMLADGLSTTLYVLGPDAAIDFLRHTSRQLEVILVLPGDTNAEARVIATPGLQGNLEILEAYRDRYPLTYLRF